MFAGCFQQIYPHAQPRSFWEAVAAESPLTFTMQRSGPGVSAAGGQRPLVGGGREGRAGTGGHMGTWGRRGAMEGSSRPRTPGDGRLHRACGNALLSPGSPHITTEGTKAPGRPPTPVSQLHHLLHGLEALSFTLPPGLQ